MDLNRTGVDHPRDRCLHQLFKAQVARSPGAPALQWQDEIWDYRRLDGAANALARVLREQGVGPERVVGVQLPRSPAMVVSLLAVLKAGGGYLPVDPEAPVARRDWLLADAGSRYLLAPPDTVPPPDPVVLIDPTAPREPLAAPSVPGLHPDQLAYVLYTSGSTGQPKGVMVSHRSVVNHMHWSQSRYPLYPDTEGDDRVLQKTPYTFDASLCDLFAPLLTGALLVLARPGGHQDGEYLVEMVRRHRISVLQLVPSLLRLLLATPGIEHCRSLRMLFCGGEALDLALVRQCLATLPVRLHNVYGPTEATIHAAGHTVEMAHRRIAIGTPVDNCRLYILDEDLNPLPVGAPGELCIGGVNLARGYANAPGLTAAGFVPDPLSGEAGARLYRSGDRCRFLPDGTVEYLGRLDRQLQFRGQRLEPGELESLLHAHPTVREAAVSLYREPGGADRLLAHVSGEPTPEPTVLAGYLRRHLPAALVPTRWVVLAALPKLPSGKLDRRALPPPDPATPARRTATAPRNPREQTLADIWAGVLKRPAVGIEDNFFELGGDSILALQVASRCRQAGLAVHPGQLFEHPTVGALAAGLTRAEASTFSLLAATGTAPRARLVGFPPLLGHGLVFRELARRLPGVAVHGLDFPLDTADPAATLAEDLAPWLAGDPPCWLLGYSAGGSLAWHCARLLEARGLAPAGLILLDARRWPGGLITDDARREGLMDRAFQVLGAGVAGELPGEAGLRRRMGAYLEYLALAPPAGSVAVPLSLILAEQPAPAGRELAALWRAASQREPAVLQGAGDHHGMLRPGPALAHNAALVGRVLAIPMLAAHKNDGG